MLRDTIVGIDGKEQPLRLRYYQSQGIYHFLALKRMVLGDATGTGKCVTGDTLIWTDHGLLPIEALAPNHEMLSESFHDPSFPVKVWTGSRWAPVCKFFWGGEVPTLRLTTQNFLEVEGSYKHPVLVRTVDGVEEFVSLANLSSVDGYVCVGRQSFSFPAEEPVLPNIGLLANNARIYKYPQKLSPDLARLLGYVVGEGWSNSHHHLNITQYRTLNPEPHDDIRSLLFSIFGWVGNENSKTKDTDIWVSSVGIRSFFSSCGIGTELSADKKVPWPILQATEESTRQFLRGIFEAEASVNRGEVEISSASEELLRLVQILLLRFGVVSHRAPKRVKGRDHIYWRVTFFGDSARLFLNRIGFISQRKTDALVLGLDRDSNPNKDTVPYLGAVLRELKQALLENVSVGGANDLRKGSGIKQFGRSFESTLSHVTLGNRNPSYPFLDRLLEVCREHNLEDHSAFIKVQEVCTNRYFYDPVRSLTQGHAPVMDLEVDDSSHCFQGNGIVNHNTIQAIGALCYMWAKEPLRALIVTPKSAMRQWEGEFDKFSRGVKVFVVHGNIEQRTKIYEAWANAPLSGDKPVLIINYALLIRDWSYGSRVITPPGGKGKPIILPGLLQRLLSEVTELAVIYDECQAFKESSTKTWQVCQYISGKAQRVYGLTATLLKNRLMEGFSIYKVIAPWLFTTKTAFMNDFCVVKLQPVKGGRKVPLVVGYRNLQQFRSRIDPVYLGRLKHEISDELPKLVTKDIKCELSKLEDAKYSEAIEGVLELGDGEVRDYSEHATLVALIYCQQIVNSLTMLRYKEGDEVGIGVDFETTHKVDMGAKEQALVELLTGEQEDSKVIVYTRFESLVERLRGLLAKEGIKSVRITGKENDTARREAQKVFLDTKSDVSVIFITAAGSEAINLQSASALVFYDAPWSWGDYVQILGRPVRIGSVHDTVVVYHLIGERPRNTKMERKTIDHHVLELLRSKKKVIDAVLGEAAVGALAFERDTSSTKDLLKRLKGSSNGQM